MKTIKGWEAVISIGLVSITSGTTSWLLGNTAVYQGSCSLRAQCEQWPGKQQEQSSRTGSAELVSSLAVSPSHHGSGPKAQPGAAEASRGSWSSGTSSVPQGLECPSPVCAPCVLHWGMAMSAKAWWPRLRVAAGIQQLFLHTFCLPPHSRLFPPWESQEPPQQRLQCPCGNTEHLTWLCRGALCLRRSRTQLSSCVIPSPATMLLYTKKNLISSLQDRKYFLNLGR